MTSQKSQNSNMLLAFLTLLGVIVLVAVVGFFMLRKGPEIIQGQAEVTEYRVSSKVPGRILEFRVKEGQTVQAGDTLAILEAPDVMAKMEQARAAEAAAQAQNEKAIKGARQEQIQAAYEMWQKAIAGVDIAEKSYKRVKNLFDQGVMPAQKLDEVTAQRNAAIATEKAAKAQYTMAKNGAEREDKMAAAALVDRAKGAVAEVESYIKETYLIAQTAGEVSEIFPKVGELVGTGAPIMNIAVMDDMWVTFNVREDLLKNLTMGSEFDAIVPALDNKTIRLKVYYMKDLGTYAAWKATKTTGQFDLKTFEVKATPVEKVDNLRPGMSVILKNERKRKEIYSPLAGHEARMSPSCVPSALSLLHGDSPVILLYFLHHADGLGTAHRHACRRCRSGQLNQFEKYPPQFGCLRANGYRGPLWKCE